jgi:hypothetical protein
MDLKEIRYEVEDWIQLTQNKIKYQGLVNIEMNLVP